MGLPGLVLGRGRPGGQHGAVGGRLERPGVGGGAPLHPHCQSALLYRDLQYQIGRKGTKI